MKKKEKMEPKTHAFIVTEVFLWLPAVTFHKQDLLCDAMWPL